MHGIHSIHGIRRETVVVVSLSVVRYGWLLTSGNTWMVRIKILGGTRAGKKGTDSDGRQHEACRDWRSERPHCAEQKRRCLGRVAARASEVFTIG
jgi:hypothetical protein